MRRLNFCISFLCLLIIMFLSVPGPHALDDIDTLRCSESIVMIGDTKYDVENKCGKPTRQQERGDLWIYDFGGTGFVYYLYFTDDNLERIQVGERGK